MNDNDDRPGALALVPCCATCSQYRTGRAPWCARWRIRVLSQTKCDSYERAPDLPFWIMLEPMETRP